MAIIYEMRSKTTGKIYIGQTTKTLTERMKQHLHDSKNKRYASRPLYIDINKYGIEDFDIKKLEEVPNDKRVMNEREKYWINKTLSFVYGYNMTFGGSGKEYVRHDDVIKLYKYFKTITAVAKAMSVSESSVKNVLKANNIPTYPIKEIRRNKYDYPLRAIYIDGNMLEFDSVETAAEYVVNVSKSKNYDSAVANIRRACLGRRNKAFGYKWEKL